MDLCSKGHDEVCFEGRNCPVCDKQTELDNANNEVDSLAKQVTDLENELLDKEK